MRVLIRENSTARFLTNEWHLNAVCALFAEIAEAPVLHPTDTVQKLTG